MLSHSRSIPLAAVLCFAASPATAKSAAHQPTVGVFITGPNASAIEGRIVKRIAGHCDVMHRQVLAGAVRNTARSLPDQSPRDLSALKSSGVALHADMLIVGRVKKVKSRHKLWLVALDVGNDDVLVDAALNVSKRKRRNRHTWQLNKASRAVKPVVQALVAMAPQRPSQFPGDDSGVVAQPAGEGEAPSLVLEALEEGEDNFISPQSRFLKVAAGMKVSGREFDYTDPMSSGLRPYNVAAVPLLTLDAALYPLASTDPTATPDADRPIADFGITFNFAQSLGFGSSLADDTRSVIANDWRELGAGMQFRMPLGAGDNGALLVTAGWKHTRFAFQLADNDPRAGEFPDVSYHSGRIAAGGAYTIGRFGLRGEAAILIPFEIGQLSERFPRGSAVGMDAEAGLSLRLWGGWMLEVSGGITRIGHDFKPRPGDANVAGGAVDQMFHGAGKLSYTL